MIFHEHITTVGVYDAFPTLWNTLNVNQEHLSVSRSLRLTLIGDCVTINPKKAGATTPGVTDGGLYSVHPYDPFDRDHHQIVDLTIANVEIEMTMTLVIHHVAKLFRVLQQSRIVTMILVQV